ncbi:single-stranded DNA-binding protein [Patescibacteria group bacterium]|nr:single-stranded DNA-binding protein [Patescibacteria group bacterium]
MSLNRAQIIGNLTRDPEMRQIPGGQVVTSFSIATNFTWTDQNGQKQDKAEFHNIVAWRKLAEICGQYLKKGSKVFIEGRMQTKAWEAEDGSKKYRTEIVADNMIMLDRKGNEMGTPGMSNDNFAQPDMASAPMTSNPTTPETTGMGNPVPSNDEVTIDDLPF